MIRVVSDTAANLSKELIDKLKITIVNFQYYVDGKFQKSPHCPAAFKIFCAYRHNAALRQIGICRAVWAVVYMWKIGRGKGSLV